MDKRLHITATELSWNRLGQIQNDKLPVEFSCGDANGRHSLQVFRRANWCSEVTWMELNHLVQSWWYESAFTDCVLTFTQSIIKGLLMAGKV